MTNRFFFLLILFSLQPAFGGDIQGQVMLESKGKTTAISNAPVRLHVYKDDYEFSGAETHTDSRGRYRFPKLDADERTSYLIYPIYEGINYPYEEINFPKGTTSIQKNFILQETTGSTKEISAEESIYFEFGKKDIWKITHEITLQNNGEFLYHPDRPDTQPIQFPLFKGGFDLSYLDGISRDNSNIDDEKDILQTLLTLAPHKPLKIKFSYYYIPETRSVAFDREAFLQRSNISLFFQKNIQVTSKQFQFDGMLSKSLPNFRKVFTSGPVAQADSIQFTIRGYYMQKDFLHIILTLVCMIFIVILVYAYVRLRKTVKTTDKVLTERMHQYLVSLKSQLKNGSISELQYKIESERVMNFLFQISKE